MAVYTSLSHTQIATYLAQHYIIGTLETATGILQGVQNTNYRIVTRHSPEMPAQKYILTLYEKRTNLEELPFFLNLMQHVTQRGIHSPQPIMRRDGRFIGEVAERPAALVSFLDGESVTTIDTPHVVAAGTALAQLHLASADFSGSRANGLSLSGWTGLYNATKSVLDTIEPGLEKLVRDELAYQAAHLPLLTSTLPRGIIHADFFPDNVFFNGTAVSGLIDFYFACSDAWAYDVAITLNAWCFEADGMLNRAKADTLLTHYQAIRPFSKEEHAAFPILLRGAALRFLLTRAYDWLNPAADATVIPKHPVEYLSKLRLHQRMGGV